MKCMSVWTSKHCLKHLGIALIELNNCNLSDFLDESREKIHTSGTVLLTKTSTDQRMFSTKIIFSFII